MEESRATSLNDPLVTRSRAIGDGTRETTAEEIQMISGTESVQVPGREFQAVRISCLDCQVTGEGKFVFVTLSEHRIAESIPLIESPGHPDATHLPSLVPIVVGLGVKLVSDLNVVGVAFFEALKSPATDAKFLFPQLTGQTSILYPRRAKLNIGVGESDVVVAQRGIAEDPGLIRAPHLAFVNDRNRLGCRMRSRIVNRQNY
jgi:hypothetical protein